MGMARNEYECPKCGATKTLLSHQVTTKEQFEAAYASLPNDLPCSWRGCDGRAIVLLKCTECGKLKRYHHGEAHLCFPEGE